VGREGGRYSGKSGVGGSGGREEKRAERAPSCCLERERDREGSEKSRE
jgi:hypothetical protein